MMDLLAEFQRRTPRSREEYERARRVIPAGVGSAVQYRPPHPLYVARAEGPRVWDLDGNSYVDYSLCFGAMIAGFAHPTINQAIREQLEMGTLYGFPTALGSRMAEELRRRYPAMEMIRFGQSGVEVAMHAVRLARAATRKDKIVKVEGAYHGALDYLMVSVAPPLLEMTGPAWAPSPVTQTLGAPIDATKNTLVIPFNDLEAAERCFDRHVGEIACLIVEPVMTNGGVILPQEGYLQRLRELTQRHNVLLIFDEVKVGCRIAPGGACELYGIQPDLVLLAKVIGGGTPLAAFGGRRHLMELLAPLGATSHQGTYNANPLVLTAGLACLTQVLVPEAYRHLNAMAALFADGLREIVRTLGVPASVAQVGGLGSLLFYPEAPRNYREAFRCDKRLWERYWFGMLNRGVIPMSGAWFEEWSVSVVHTEQDIHVTLNAAEDVLREIIRK